MDVCVCAFMHMTCVCVCVCVRAGIPVIATQRDPTMYEYGMKPSSDQGAYATTHSGGMMVS